MEQARERFIVWLKERASALHKAAEYSRIKSENGKARRLA
jgi:hypothetical protein